MNNYLEADSRDRNKIKVELDLSNYATKSDLKRAQDIDTSECNKKLDLASLKSNFDKLDITKLKRFTTYLRKLSNILENIAFQKQWLKKVNTIGATDVVKLNKKTEYNTRIEEI